MILIAQLVILLYVADGLAAAARIGNLLYGFYNRGAA